MQKASLNIVFNLIKFRSVLKLFILIINSASQDGAAMFGRRPGRSAKTMLLFTVTYVQWSYIQY